MTGKNSAALKVATSNKNRHGLKATLSAGALTASHWFDHFKLKENLLASHYGVDILLPKLPQEAHPWAEIIEVDQEFESDAGRQA